MKVARDPNVSFLTTHFVSHGGIAVFLPRSTFVSLRSNIIPALLGIFFTLDKFSPAESRACEVITSNYDFFEDESPTLLEVCLDFAKFPRSSRNQSDRKSQHVRLLIHVPPLVNPSLQITSQQFARYRWVNTVTRVARGEEWKIASFCWSFLKARAYL